MKDGTLDWSYDQHEATNQPLRLVLQLSSARAWDNDAEVACSFDISKRRDETDAQL